MAALRIRREARAELDAAFEWYRSRDTATADRFLRQVRGRFLLLSSVPNVGSPMGNEGLRRMTVEGFPFVLVYVHNDGVVTIIALAHTRRRPGYWRRRLR